MLARMFLSLCIFSSLKPSSQEVSVQDKHFDYKNNTLTQENKKDQAINQTTKKWFNRLYTISRQKTMCALSLESHHSKNYLIRLTRTFKNYINRSLDCLYYQKTNAIEFMKTLTTTKIYDMCFIIKFKTVVLYLAIVFLAIVIRIVIKKLIVSFKHSMARFYNQIIKPLFVKLIGLKHFFLKFSEVSSFLFKFIISKSKVALISFFLNIKDSIIREKLKIIRVFRALTRFFSLKIYNFYIYNYTKFYSLLRIVYRAIQMKILCRKYGGTISLRIYSDIQYCAMSELFKEIESGNNQSYKRGMDFDKFVDSFNLDRCLYSIEY